MLREIDDRPEARDCAYERRYNLYSMWSARNGLHERGTEGTGGKYIRGHSGVLRKVARESDRSVLAVSDHTDFPWTDFRSNLE